MIKDALGKVIKKGDIIEVVLKEPDSGGFKIGAILIVSKTPNNKVLTVEGFHPGYRAVNKGFRPLRNYQVYADATIKIGKL